MFRQERYKNEMFVGICRREPFKLYQLWWQHHTVGLLCHTFVILKEDNRLSRASLVNFKTVCLGDTFI